MQNPVPIVLHVRNYRSSFSFAHAKIRGVAVKESYDITEGRAAQILRGRRQERQSQAGSRAVGELGAESDSYGLQESNSADPGDRQGGSNLGVRWSDFGGGTIRHLIEDCDRQVASILKLIDTVSDLLGQEIAGINSRKTQLEHLLRRWEAEQHHQPEDPPQ